MHRDTTNRALKSLATLGLSLVLAVSMLTPAGNAAYADVRKADVIFGKTVDSRGPAVVQCPDLDAEYAIAVSGDGDVYFERNATTPTKIASITKIMTALVALDVASPDTLITVSQRAASVGESSASLQSGDVLTFENALKGLMVSSGNDAAIAIAESLGTIISGGTAEGEAAEQVFIDKMNEKALELGLVDSYFTNPHGLDFDSYESEQHSCALDVSTIAREAMKNEQFRQAVATSETSISVTHADGSSGEIYLETTNALLGVYEGNCGIKTGITEAAGYCFAGIVNRDDTEVYTVILKASDETVRFIDTQVLDDWVFEHLIDYQLAHSEKSMQVQVSGTIRVMSRVR